MGTSEQNRKYYLKNKEYILASNKRYYQKNKKRIYEKHKESIKRFHYTPKGHYKIIKRNAKKRGLSVLSQEAFLHWYDKQDKSCVYCGVSEEVVKKYPAKVRGIEVRRLTVDRKDNNIGYEVDNIVLACYYCNQTKGSLFSYEEMKELSKLFIKPKWQSLS